MKTFVLLSLALAISFVYTATLIPVSKQLAVRKSDLSRRNLGLMKSIMTSIKPLSVRRNQEVQQTMTLTPDGGAGLKSSGNITATTSGLWRYNLGYPTMAK